MTSPPSLVFQHILRSLRDHPDEDSDEDYRDGACGECGLELDSSHGHPEDFLFHHVSHHQHWTDSGKCSKCTDRMYDYHHHRSKTGAALATAAHAAENHHHVHWADDDKRELVRSRPRKKYTRHPAKASPAKPILKQGSLDHEHS